MTIEGEQPTEARPEERSLVVRSDKTSLSNLNQNPFLEMTGFSPQFSERLMRLNDTLAPQQVRRIGIELQPGQTPMISTSIEFDSRSGYRVNIIAFPGSQTVEIAITGSGHVVALGDIKTFAAIYLPNRPITMSADANPYLIDPIEPFNKDIQAVAEAELKTWFEERPAHPYEGEMRVGGRIVAYPYGGRTAEIKIDKQDLPLLVTKFVMVHYDQATVGCELANGLLYYKGPVFFYHGSSEESEMLMDGLVDLFGKHPYYNYPFKRIN